MIYPKEKSSGLAAPVLAILLAMAGILAALVSISDPRDRQGGRVWVFQQQSAGAAYDEGRGIDRHHK